MDADRDTTTPPSTAARLAGRYELGEPLGKGRSTVYRATDLRLQRPVAVKQVEIAAGQEDAERVRSRALREAQAAARLNNPSVVTVYDVVEESGSIWLVMELVEAPSLAQVVADEGPVSHARTAQVGLDVLAALEAAHAVGIVHRDVKPANVLVTPGDRAKLTDFGVATIRDDSRLTATGLIVGSPSYMSPEQARGDLVGPATDLWALGALLYFATEGEPPFQGDSALATASAVVHGTPRPAQHPGGVSVIVTRLLMKDPANRATPSEVRAALHRAARTTTPRPSVRTDPTIPLAAAPVPATPAPDEDLAPARPGGAAALAAARTGDPAEPAAQTLSGAPAAVSRSGLAVPASGRLRLLLLVAAALVVLLGAMAVGALTGGDGDNDNASPPSTTATTEAPATTTTTTEQTTTTTAATTTTTVAEGVPAGWTAYQDPTRRYRIAYPAGWEVVPVSRTLTDFRDPATGAKLRVDWTDTPGADPAQAWRDLAVGFASTHPDYVELGISPTTYRDYNAALWEFSYGSGPTTHATNLGFVTGGRGYALLFTAPEEQWAASQATSQQFREAFQPVPA